jgi:hypothetical protein
VFWFEVEGLLESHKVKILSVDFFALKNFRNRFGQLSFLEILYNELDLIQFDRCMGFLRHSFNLAPPTFLKLFGFFLFLRYLFLNVLFLLETDV